MKKFQKFQNDGGGYDFGDYSLSSKIVDNNFDTVAQVLVSMAKLSLVGVIIRCKSKRYFVNKMIKKTLQVIFISELISYIPFVNISAMTSVLSSLHNYAGRFEKGLQTSLSFFCFLLVPLWLILRYGLIQKQFKNVKKLKKD